MSFNREVHSEGRPPVNKGGSFSGGSSDQPTNQEVTSFPKATQSGSSASSETASVQGFPAKADVFRSGPAACLDVTKTAQNTAPSRPVGEQQSLGCLVLVDPNEVPQWTLFDWLADNRQDLTYGQLEALRKEGLPRPKTR